jgi:choline dehydrogenase-like flavoprotein
MKFNCDSDVIVVGSGATGIWAARTLAQKGHSVILLERGDIPKEEMTRLVHSRSLITPMKDDPYAYPKDRPFLWQKIRALGGRTNSWGRVCLRMSDLDFHAADRDGCGKNWPISYSDLKPFYDEVEKAFRVCGFRNHLRQIPDGKFRHYKISEIQRRAMTSFRKKWPGRPIVPGRLATRFPIRLLESGMGHGKISVYLNQRVLKIMSNDDGKLATGVITLDPRTQKISEFRARRIALCGSTIDTAWLLLNSKSRHHPRGLGNSSDQLGRNLMEHTLVDCTGILPSTHYKRKLRNPEVLYIPQFQNMGRQDQKHVRGFGTQIIVYPCERKKGHDCGFSKHDPAAHKNHFRIISFGEVLPSKSNRVTLARRAKDRFGLPLPLIDFRYSRNEIQMQNEQAKFLAQMAVALNFKAVGSPRIGGPGESIHEVGTARMGTDPSNSVVNSFNQVWDMLNVYVMDGACFVSSGVQNPTLTMLALCSRACDNLSKSLKRS